jgi:hypothetical protein
MMMQTAVQHILDQLSGSLQQLSDEEYRQPLGVLSNASIGQHVRHTIEMFHCLESGYESGTVNYENRKRDIRIETDSALAITLLDAICGQIGRADKPLQMANCFGEHGSELVTVQTNYLREVAYNLEHAIHHMALIKIGLQHIGTVAIPESYGVAASTMKHRQECAQ